jgi:molybdopterin/thiamine biosynthesis adenylyltransferase
MAGDFVLTRVPLVLALVEAGGEALLQGEDPQGEPITTYYGGTTFGGVIVDGRAHTGPVEDASHGRLWFASDRPPEQWMLPQDTTGDVIAGQALLVRLEGESGEELADCDGEPLRKRFGPSREGRWVHLQNPPLTDSAVMLWDAARAVDPTIDAWTRSAGLKLLGLHVREELTQASFGPSWVFVVRNVTQVRPSRKKARSGNPSVREGNKLLVGDPVVVRALRWTDEAMSVRIPELAKLPERKVALVGLGSLGAPIFQELVKARVGTLRIVDGDYVDPGTGIRFPLGLADAGVSKVGALRRWAFMHNPATHVEAHHVRIGSAPETREFDELEFLESVLADADLLVNATAEMDISRQLDRVAVHLGLPRMHVWSQSGYGGVVARLRSGSTGCLHCLELKLSELDATGRPAVEVPPAVQSIQAPGCADQTFTATHPDLLPIAVHAASVAFGELSGDAGYEAFEDDVFTVQSRSASGARIAPAWSSFKLPPNPSCPMCTK